LNLVFFRRQSRWRKKKSGIRLDYDPGKNELAFTVICRDSSDNVLNNVENTTLNFNCVAIFNPYDFFENSYNQGSPGLMMFDDREVGVPAKGAFVARVGAVVDVVVMVTSPTSLAGALRAGQGLVLLGLDVVLGHHRRPPGHPPGHAHQLHVVQGQHQEPRAGGPRPGLRQRQSRGQHHHDHDESFGHLG